MADDAKQPTTIFEAIEARATDAVRARIAADPSCASARNEHGVSALMVAMYYGLYDAAEAIIESIDAMDIFESCATGQAGYVASLLNDDKAAVSSYSADGYTPLHLAAFFGHEAVVYLLLNDGAPVNAVAANSMRVQPLHSAVARGSVGVVKQLLDHGANPDSVQRGGYTPLMGAAAAGLREIITLLIDADANRQLRSDDGQTATELARARGQQEIADWLDAV